jgi:hypothetical protein
MGLDEELMKALNGYGGGAETAHTVDQYAPPPQSATNFDNMAFDLDSNGLNFDVCPFTYKKI